MIIRIALWVLSNLVLTGYAPRWHDGQRVWHTIRDAIVYDDSLSIQGVIDPQFAFTDYGVKVNRVVDDKGTTLPFRSYQTFWAKELCFELECAAPEPSAHSVEIDILFLTRAGKQQLTIVRGKKPDYATQLRVWKTAKPIER